MCDVRCAMCHVRLVTEFHLHSAQHAVRVFECVNGRWGGAQQVMGCYRVLVEDVNGSDVCQRRGGGEGLGSGMSADGGLSLTVVTREFARMTIT